MNRMSMKTIFLTVATAREMPFVRLMVDSLRTFGRKLAQAPVWVFTEDQYLKGGFNDEYTRILPLKVAGPVSTYPFGSKVTACARAEEFATKESTSLVYIDSACLVIQPPSLFELDADCDAAFRPVHIRNVGIPPFEPLDAFWRGIYTAVGVDDISSSVTSFVDGQILRTYFNSHAFSVQPALGLMQNWLEIFQRLVGDLSFQRTACADESHQVFLFQALLSALVAKSVDPERLRILPPNYNYPYHLQEQIPTNKRLGSLNDAVCITYEDLPVHPETITGIEIHQPLKNWLTVNAPTI
jgi:hypothetical protein